MSRKILLLGAGGHCKSVIDTLNSIGSFEDIGVVEKDKLVDSSFENIAGYDDDLSDLYNAGYEYAFVTLGSIGNPKNRINLLNKIMNIGFKIPNIIDPSAIVSNNIVMGYGNFIGKRAVINTGTIIGNGVIVNTGSIVEHDCKLENFVHLAPGSILCGNVTISENSHIGAGTVVKQNIMVGSNTIIGVGSVIINNISSNVIAYGNPCKEVKKNEG
ncbi:MAG: acetyltransferase [Tissierellales bacterium]|nr:acetyltransferase [Tissierellales bacterium]